jgi:glycosyltransferase involved in cell wall biosynthesis
MSSKIAYVVNGYITRSNRTDAPSTDFDTFAAKSGADLFSFASLSEIFRLDALGKSAERLRTVLLASKVASKAHQYAAIITSGEDVGVFVALACRALRKRTRVVIVFHGPQLQSWKFRIFFGRVTRDSNVVFACLSHSLRDVLIRSYGVDPDRCVGAGYGIDTNFFKRSGRSSEKFLASAGVSNRDYNTLLSAISDIGVEARIAADSAWVKRDIYEGLVTIPPHVEIRSYENYANLRELYDRCRFVVVPTYASSFASGFAVIGEAMAMGKPVIVTSGPVQPDYFIPGETGLEVPAGNIEMLRAAILRLMEDDSLVERMGANAAQTIRTDHSLERYCERLEQLARSNPQGLRN